MQFSTLAPNPHITIAAQGQRCVDSPKIRQNGIIRMQLHSLFAIAISAFMLSACGGEEAPQARTTPETSPAPQQTAPTPPPAPTAPVQAQAGAPAVEKEPSPEFASLPAPYVDADYARGKRVWRQCSSCHTLAADADHLVGPNLYGLFGRQVGSSEGFNYSSAVQEADFLWTPEKLNEWLTSPRNFLPGNRMSFAGVRKPQDRDNVIAYLMIESGWSAQ